MAGRAKRQLDQIVAAVSKGNATLSITIKTKLILKGLDPERFTAATPDDPAILDKIKKVAAEFGVSVI